MRRDTRQRNAICQALADEGRPLSVGELFTLAQDRAPGLGIATVYRNLKALQSEEQVVQVNLPGQPPRWELTPPAHHHHFLCRTCDRLLEIHDCPENLQRLLPRGYTLEEHDILLRGQCNACAARGKPAANPG